MNSTPFSPAGPGDDWRRNAVQHMREDDAWLGFGFVSAADALIQHWVEHGPNDGHLMPIILTYRHGLELLLKAGIRDSAACLRREGDQDPKISRQAIDKWLARDAGHSLQRLANRLDQYLDRLDEDRLPTDTHDVLSSLHTLDLRGDTFRYATTWDKAAQRYVPPPRPLASHIDVVAMGKKFGAAASLIGGGVLTVLELIREYQEDILRDAEL